MNVETARAQMLGQQIRAWEVLDDRVLDVLQKTPRERFVPEEYRDLAFADIEIPIGREQSMMAPKIEGRLLQALQITPIDRVLEIGTGSGYVAACLAGLAKSVHTVDIYADFVDGACVKLAAQRIYNVELNATDAMTASFAERYDAIAVTGSVPVLDDRFIRLLRPGGRLFIVVGRAPVMEALLITMRADGQWLQESLFETVIAPLVNSERPEPFVL